MLVTCPHCGDKIGEGQTQCPMCNAEFTKEDMVRMAAERSSVLREVQLDKYNRLLAFRKKHKIFLIALLISLILLIFSVPLSLELYSTRWFFLSFVPFLGLPAVLIAGISTGAARCPFCGAVLMRQHGEFCTRCGERIL